MAKGLIKDLSEAPLSVQLKIKAIGRKKNMELGSSTFFIQSFKFLLSFGSILSFL